MSSMTIRKLDDRVKEKIWLRAAKSGHSMEEEARRLLAAAVDLPVDEERGLGTAIRQRFAPLGGFKLESTPTFDNVADAIRHIIDPIGGIELDLPPREVLGAPPRLGRKQRKRS